MTNLAAQIAADLTNTFLRVDNGWAESAVLSRTGGTVYGVFDDGTADAGVRGGPAWWCKESDGYVIGDQLVIGSRGTFRIEAINPQDDGELFEALLDLLP